MQPQRYIHPFMRLGAEWRPYDLRYRHGTPVFSEAEYWHNGYCALALTFAYEGWLIQALPVQMPNPELEHCFPIAMEATQ